MNPKESDDTRQRQVGAMLKTERLGKVYILNDETIQPTPCLYSQNTSRQAYYCRQKTGRFFSEETVQSMKKP